MKNTKRGVLALLAGILVTGTALAQNIGNLSPEQQQLLIQLLLRQQQAAGQASSPTQNAQPVKYETEEFVGTKLAQLRDVPGGVSFERFRDGFAIEGRRYLEPEGNIISYGFSSHTGDFTYVAETGSNQFVIKSGRADNSAEPMTIANAQRQGRLWQITTVTGKKFSGERMSPLARGFIVARDNTGFRYVPGRGTTNIAAPEEFTIAALQSGDVYGTGYILLERTPESNGTSGNSPIGGLISSVKALGSTLGIGRKDDYALLNIDTKTIVPINISMESKQVQVMSACRQRNFLIAECARMDSYESLFDQNGQKNLSHYFWRVYWFNVGGRPVLVSQEGGLSKVAVTDLSSGKKAIIFERALGVGGFYASQDKMGTIAVTAKMGFSSESVSDAVAALDAPPAGEPSKASPEEPVAAK